MYDRKQNQSICKVNKNDDITVVDKTMQCGKILLGSKVSNLTNHIKKMHPKTYSHYCKLNNVEIKKASAEVPSKSKQLSNSKISNCMEKKSISIQFTKRMVMKSLLSEVTVDGRPFSSIEDEDYSIFAKPAIRAFNINYHRQNISELVGEGADFIRNELKKDLECHLVSIKVDCATRHGRSFLGMNVQLVKEGKVVVYTLAIKEILIRHTSDNLKTLILQELDSYGISPKHIYTITSDGGANLVKAVNLIEDSQHEDDEAMSEEDSLNQ